MAQTVVGLFHDHQAAQHVVEQLLSAGFSNDQIQLSKRTPTENQSNKEEGDSSIARFLNPCLAITKKRNATARQVTIVQLLRCRRNPETKPNTQPSY